MCLDEPELPREDEPLIDNLVQQLHDHWVQGQDHDLDVNRSDEKQTSPQCKCSVTTSLPLAETVRCILAHVIHTETDQALGNNNVTSSISNNMNTKESTIMKLLHRAKSSSPAKHRSTVSGP